MITSTEIDIQISNNGKYWTDLGYGPLKQRDIITVRVSDLPPNSNKMVAFSCDDCGEVDERQYQLLFRQTEHRCFACARKHIGKHMDSTKASAANKLRVGPKHPRWNPNKSALTEYARKVRWFSEKTYRENISIINPHGYIRGRCGVPGAWQLDHIKSVKQCFEEGLTPEQCADVENLQMLSWEENRRKWA
ncbi:hypothetical protein PHIM7_79 [Sinorhizobium phage phiM7]|uniref:Uncharacterized protein n=2 Tax=Emdodecavirus TaxID=1980937 RepID=S5MAT9_9CAUD|nr:hypothetical protein AB690_gp086 [Sinorhizobium phage phiM12]YP_009601204.1 hypothetical protein FDH46_gp079 [Sinorhizobium phage phiM7]AGR47738.1 hypothetical protein SmphiM12_106 [Sinorhizobium phage phiM12]AKF12627.1 hypothetical protein PHIM7_79 [Sinorhizobium phage phiM7]AKF12987.1 hypothetical protein PHIM19_80 [Sinorhizobium phage phiM19]